MYTDSTGGHRDSLLGHICSVKLPKENTHFPEIYVARGSGIHLLACKMSLACES